MATRQHFKILTVGDGDFSFSLALVRAERCRGTELCATSYDSYDFLVQKYGETAENNVKELMAAGAVVQHSVDATRLEESLKLDVLANEVHFMHPLIDAEDKDKLARGGSITCNSDYIIANRMLVLNFLRSASGMLARPNGEILVTIKDVYPYSWWRVGRLARYTDQLRLRRVESFVAESLPGYIARTVDRDGTLPVESASSYVFGLQEEYSDGTDTMITSFKQDAEHWCDTCDKSFTSQGDRVRHLGNRKHNARTHLEERWALVVNSLPTA